MIIILMFKIKINTELTNYLEMNDNTSMAKPVGFR